MQPVSRDAASRAGASLLAAAGIGTAFAAAACCGLPLVLVALGLSGGAWLLDIALVAGPWQRLLLWSAVGAPPRGGRALGYRGRRAACAGDAGRGFRALLLLALALGGGLVGLALAAG
jgi:mercuric ion transport protein